MDSSIFSPVPRSSHIVVLDWWRPSSQAAPLICGSENGRIGNCGAVISVDELHERYDDRGGLFNRIHLTEGVPLRIKKTFEIQRVDTHCYSLSSSWCVYYKGNKSFFFSRSFWVSPAHIWLNSALSWILHWGSGGREEARGAVQQVREKEGPGKRDEQKRSTLTNTDSIRGGRGEQAIHEQQNICHSRYLTL